MTRRTITLAAGAIALAALTAGAIIAPAHTATTAFAAFAVAVALRPEPWNGPRCLTRGWFYWGGALA